MRSHQYSQTNFGFFQYLDEALSLFRLWWQQNLVKSTKLKPLYLWEYWELEARKKTEHTYEVSTFQFWAVIPEGKFFSFSQQQISDHMEALFSKGKWKFSWEILISEKRELSWKNSVQSRESVSVTWKHFLNVFQFSGLELHIWRVTVVNALTSKVLHPHTHMLVLMLSATKNEWKVPW